MKKKIAVLGLCALASCGGSGGSVGSAPLIPVALSVVEPTARPIGAPTTVPTSVPTTTAIPNGFVTKWGLELAVSETCTANLSNVLAVHASVVRIQYLQSMLPKRCFDGVYTAAGRANLKIVWITPSVNLNAPIDYAAYAQIMATAASAYPGGVWEIMNEPDVVQPQLNADWPNEQLAVNEYVVLAQATALAIHAADSTAVVLSGGPSGIEASNRALPWLHAAVNLAPLIDGVSFHPYAGYDSSEFQDVKSLYNKPVYVTEWQTNDGGIIEGVLRSFNGLVPMFVYCAQACSGGSAIPIFP